MKKLLAVGLVLFMAMLCSCGKAGVKIDEKHFPDENFRSFVCDEFDINGDKYLDDEEIAKSTVIDCSEKSIHTLEGIEYFTALENLNCAGNEITELDVSKCTSLKYLSCSNIQSTILGSYCKLTSLDVSGCTSLVELYCNTHQLTSLDISKCTSLRVLDCGNNQLTSLDVSKCTSLNYLDCSVNQITSLDISKCTSLESLSCGGNQIPLLDVSRCTSLKMLSCFGNQIAVLDVSNCDLLEHLILPKKSNCST